jgi:hypothetical protein
VREGGFTSIVFGRCFLSWCSTKERWGTFQRLYGFITVLMLMLPVASVIPFQKIRLDKRLYY